MKQEEIKFFIGIDLGWKEKKTTGICVLGKNGRPQICKDIVGKNVLRVIQPYLKSTQVIAIDAPLTRGRGKGKLRLYEKFLLTKTFRQEKVAPIPPALMSKLCDFARELVEKLEEKRFVLNINLIEAFPTLLKKICKKELILKSHLCQGENQESALLCAQLALWHSQFKTRYLGYKDGFLFLPEIAFWKKDWQKNFYQAWKEKHRLKYKHLITNLFQ